MSGLVRSNLVVASGTLASRVTGLLRVIVFAYVIGQTALADAYKLANETPNIVYDLLIGGVLSATLVPVFTSLSVDGRDTRRRVDAIVTTAMTAVIALTIIAVIAAPFIFRLYSITLSPEVDADAFRSAGTTLARLFLIQILFYGLTGIMNALLHARERFLAAAWSPVLANLVVIASLLSLPGAGSTDRSIADIGVDSRLTWTLGLGATAGIAVMAIVVAIAVARSGPFWRPVWAPRDPDVRKVMTMGGWTFGFVIANQIALAVVRNLAEPGSALASAYFDAFTFFVLPHGLLAVSIATTLQPRLARAVATGDRVGLAGQLTGGIRAIVAVTAPAGAMLIVLAAPLIRVLMERGRFDAEDTANTADALRGLAVGLVGFSVFLFVLRGFYAHHDTRTPFWLNVIENGLNVALAFMLVGPLGVGGLGVALGIAYLVAAVLAVIVLQRRWVSELELRSLTHEVARLLGSAIVAGLIMAALAAAIHLDNRSAVWTAAGIAATAAVGAIAHWAISNLFQSVTMPRPAAIRDFVSRATRRDRLGG